MYCLSIIQFYPWILLKIPVRFFSYAWKLEVCSWWRKIIRCIVSDLSRPFDCLSHELVLAKLHAYGFSIAALRLIHSYLTNRMQRTKVNLSYSFGEKMLFDVPQGSILRPLLFNIFLCDLFFIMNKLCIS